MRQTVVLVAVVVLLVVAHDPAEARRTATRAACVEACDAATGDCIAAAGTNVTKKGRRRCRRRTLRRCMRTGLEVCPPPAPPDPPDPCLSVPDIVGTWEGAARCTKTCNVAGQPYEQPCSGTPSPLFRVRFDRQNTPSCGWVVMSEPYEASGMFDLASVPVTFELEEYSGLGLIHNKRVRGRIEDDGRLSVQLLSAASASIVTPFCSTTLSVGPMTRVAVD